MQQAASRGTTLQALTVILKNPDHPHFMRALEYATDRGYGRELQPIGGDLNVVHGVLRVPATETPEAWSKRLAT